MIAPTIALIASALAISASPSPRTIHASLSSTGVSVILSSRDTTIAHPLITRQDPNENTIKECTNVLDKAITAINASCKSYTVNKKLPLSASDINEVRDGFNAVAMDSCNGEACRFAGVPFAEEAGRVCPAGYSYMGTPATEFTKDRLDEIKKAGLCTVSSSGEYCIGQIMVGLFLSVTNQGTDPVKYREAVCSDCVRNWINSGSKPLSWNNVPIDAAEATKVCGPDFLNPVVSSTATTLTSSSSTLTRKTSATRYAVTSSSSALTMKTSATDTNSKSTMTTSTTTAATIPSTSSTAKPSSTTTSVQSSTTTTSSPAPGYTSVSSTKEDIVVNGASSTSAMSVVGAVAAVMAFVVAL
ncbi:hypothetical protein HDU67_008315 [Dinochytrium kinnereticum]|nr:hypothetical protein HDU67_008315 [Dinochytrium kinnereticum]